MILKPIIPLPTKNEKLIRIFNKGIKIYSGASELLEIKELDRLLILQDESEPKNIYLKKSNKEGYILHKRGNILACNCSSVSRRIMDILSIEEGLFKIGEAENHNGEDVTPVITRINYYEK